VSQAANQHVLEVAIFKVKAEFIDDMPALRAGLRAVLTDFPGMLEFCGYCPLEQDVFADIVKWDSLASAQAAAQAFAQGDPRFLPYMSAIEQLSFMGHFLPEVRYTR
jgi:hypothetical protein